LTKLERLALKYRINLAEGKQPDGPSVTTLASIPVQVKPQAQRQSEYERLKQEFQLAKQRLQEFVTRDKRERVAVRQARAQQ
jgi:hypothetical protein